MKTELICVGTELLGAKLNTNSAYIGERLSTLGLDLSFETTVGDNMADMEQVLRQAVARSGIIFVTGGLGPTFDDLTREAVAKVLGRPLVTNPEALAAIKALFERRNWTMTKNNERQAQLIEGGKFLPNPNGTAPGQVVEAGKTLFFLLPGPPREMQPMFEHHVLPQLKKYAAGIKKSFVLHLCGLGESTVDDKIRPIIDAERKLESGVVDFTILAHQMLVDIKASVSGKDEMLIDETITNLRHEFREVLGDNIYGEDKLTLEGAVGELLVKHKRTLALAESCTGGLVAQKITNVAGSSLYFRQGVVTYSNESKVKVLGVKEQTLHDLGAVSEQTAREMAEGIRSLSGADYTISITGIAGPSGGTPEKPVGLVFMGLAGPERTEVFRFQFPGGRADIRERASNQALDLLRRRLMSEQAPGKNTNHKK